MTELHHILKISYLDIFPTEHFALRLQVYLWFPEFLKVEWEVEPSVIRLLSVEPAASLGSGSRRLLYLYSVYFSQ